MLEKNQLYCQKFSTNSRVLSEASLVDYKQVKDFISNSEINLIGNGVNLALDYIDTEKFNILNAI